MSDDSSSSESRGPQPQGLQGALQWLVANVPEAVSSAAAAVEHGQPQPGGAATSSAPSSTSAPAMSEERRQFLANALSSLQRDYLADIKEALQQLTANDATDEDKEQALETIAFECEDINVAQDFAKLGGTAPVLACLSSDNPELQWRAADVLANLTQNFPLALNQAQDNDYFSLLRPLLIRPEEKVRLKALRAISCMVRGSNDHDEVPTDQSMSRDTSWVTDVVKCVRTPGNRVQVKAVHLLRHLLASDERFRQAAMDAGLLEALATALVADEDNQLWEQGLHLLVDLRKKRNSLVSDLEREQPALLRTMTARRSGLMHLPADDKDAHQEEMEYMTALLGALQT